MKIIIGLGNPEEQYAGTRHSAGILLVNEVSAVCQSTYGWRRYKNIYRWESEDKELVLIKSADIFMNESGRMATELKDKTGILYVAHDDLDIKLGEYKIQLGVGPKIHYGVNSVEQALGTKEFWRIRIGIENRKPESRVAGDEYVLQRFNQEEREVVDEVVKKITKDLEIQ